MRCTMSPASLFSSTTGAGKIGWFLFVRLCSEYLRVAEYWIMVLLGYHVELVWHYAEDKSYHLPLVPGFTSYVEDKSYHLPLVPGSTSYAEDKSYHLPLVPGSTSYSETPAAQEVAATWQLSNKSTEHILIAIT